MATLPNSAGAALHQEALPDFVLVRTDETDLGDRLRPVDKVWASALGEMMAKDGQDTPIQVCRLPGRNRWTVVVGGHRFVGAQTADIEYLRAEIVSADRDDRRLREVRENIMRTGLAPLDRAAFVAEAVSIYKRRAGIDPAKPGRAVAADARWKKAISDEASDANDTMSFAYGWSDQVADQIGLNKRTIERDLLIYRRLAPSLVEKLRAKRHPALANATQLRALAKLDEHSQAKVVDLLTVPGASLNYGVPATIADAIAHPLGPKPAKAKAAPDQKRQNAFLGAFKRMGAQERVGALAHLATLLPKGTRIVDGSEPSPKPTFSPQHEQYREEALAAIDAMRDLVEGLLEDEVVQDERHDALRRASGALQLTRFTISGNGFEIGGGTDAA